jgi:hypothetical protein
MINGNALYPSKIEQKGTIYRNILKIFIFISHFSADKRDRHPLPDIKKDA